ncbi:hypothetical protein PV721_35790 [Streptomyces sp. MB09-01]|uniref:telomere-protecting terminal protein Tpg n=1 Tax=Streptomyces sp. MB09-01 TaxID=3028666 RepID=UPI0029BF6667|nr:hypothetical protein [Streptomyces sp. MB09-01]MDX3539598.1 hypothetical protein [Streptomyces sp. MB09-01]
MGEIEDAIKRADREGFTREPPRTLEGRINFLVRQVKSTRAVAEELGVSQRSVERYRKGDRKAPPKAITDRIGDAVRTRRQPVARGRRCKHAAASSVDPALWDVRRGNQRHRLPGPELLFPETWMARLSYPVSRSRVVDT